MVGLDRATLADLRGRAEIHVLRGELALAYYDLDVVRELRGFAPNAIDDAEDLRVMAAVRAAEGDLVAAERSLREVIRRAEVHGRPQLQADALRDLATVLLRMSRHAEATVPNDRSAGSKRPCGDEMHIGSTHATLAKSAA
jgi:predicted RNA-binding Zn ribbon-like protein